MITMYGHVPAWGVPDISPYVTKIDCYLRMTRLPYELVLGDLDTAPKGKLPYIEDGDRTIADTSFIVEYLKATYGDPLDSTLSSEQRAIALAFWRLMDESFYWTLVQARYRRDEDFKMYDPLWAMFFAALEPDARRAAIQDARDRLLLEFHQSGRGRQSYAEAEHIGCREVEAIAGYLADKDYFFGANPSSTDAAIYGFLSNLLYAPFPSGVRDYANSQPNIVAYMERISTAYYPELTNARGAYLP
jgi:isoprene-epoxide---glutathione S-transferase